MSDERIPDGTFGGSRELIGSPDSECQVAGHVWEHQGGGLYICMRCETEAWGEEIHMPQPKDAP